MKDDDPLPMSLIHEAPTGSRVENHPLPCSDPRKHIESTKQERFPNHPIGLGDWMISDFVKGLFWSFGNQQEFLFGKYVQEIGFKRVEKGNFFQKGSVHTCDCSLMKNNTRIKTFLLAPTQILFVFGKISCDSSSCPKSKALLQLLHSL